MNSIVNPPDAVVKPACFAKCRILMVDDSEDDVTLVRRALTRGGIGCKIHWVNDPRSLSEAIEQHAWDLIIADYSLPGFGALAVLDLINDRGLDLPCIVVSGVAGEDRAVETMRAGAKDFVSKDRLQRLAPAVQRELAEHALRRDRARAEALEEAREHRMHDASAALLDLMRSRDYTAGDPDRVYGVLSELAARTLDVDRVAIWMFESAGERFVCCDMYEVAEGVHRTGMGYDVSSNPEYFATLEQRRLVEAHGAAGIWRNDTGAPPTEGDRIGAQLDAAIRLRGRTVGALCIDHWERARRWRSDEQVFAGSIADLISLAMEASERRRAEAALRESEVRYRELWQNALDGIFTLDLQGRITSANAAARRLIGVSASGASKRPFTEFLDPADAARTQAAYEGILRGETPAVPFPFAIIRPSGERVLVEATAQRIERRGELVECLAIVRDVTQRRYLEAQLQQSQKMEAIGRLAGGVAHDFNNLLTAIIGYAQMASLRPDMSPAAAVDLREISSAAHRAAALTRQLLAFSRKQVLEPRVLDVNRVVSGIEGLLRRLIGEDIEFFTILQPGLRHVLADPGQLEQVILNLVVNARDAMPDGGRLTLRTRMAASLAKGVIVTADQSAGPFVTIEVSDTGVGMDAETRLRIFEPFFTTKNLGTGLGLSTVYGIVQQSGGGIGVTSAPGKGSVFTVALPVAIGECSDGDASDPLPLVRGSESVLVVEDDEGVRALAARILRGTGYRVLEAASAEEALGAVLGAGEPVDLILTDVVLPRMDGRHLVAEIRKARPDVRALYMSGYRSGAEERLEDDGFIAKPFSPDGLVSAVRCVLDAGRESRVAGRGSEDARGAGRVA